MLDQERRNYLADLSDIPEKLKKELSGKVDIHSRITEALTYFDGIASLDHIIVYLYRRYRLQYTRAYIYGYLKDMKKSGTVWPDEKLKGHYTLVDFKMSEEPEQQEPESKPAEEEPEEEDQQEQHEQPAPEPEPQTADEDSKKKYPYDHPYDLDKIYLEAMKQLGGRCGYDELFKKVNKKHKTTKRAVMQTVSRLLKKGLVERIEPGFYGIKKRD